MPALTGEGVQARLVQSPGSIFPARFSMVSLLSHGRYRPWLAGCAVAVMGFIVSYWAVLQQRESVGIIEQTRFTQRPRRSQTRWAARGSQHRDRVFCTAFSLNPSLGRADFDRVVTELDAARRYPGVRNLAFTKRVAREDKAAYEESVRNDPSLAPAHRASFAIRPRASGTNISSSTTSGRCAAMPRCWGWTSAPSPPTWPPCISAGTAAVRWRPPLRPDSRARPSYGLCHSHSGVRPATARQCGAASVSRGGRGHAPGV